MQGFRVKCKFREEILKIYILGSFHIESLQEVFTKKIGSYRVDILRGANSTCFDIPLIRASFTFVALSKLSPSRKSSRKKLIGIMRTLARSHLRCCSMFEFGST